MNTLLQDLRYGWRNILKNRSFSTIAVLMLALGIGANTAIFSVVHAVLLRPLPFKESDRVVMIFERFYKAENKKNVTSTLNYLKWKERATSFESLSGMTNFAGNITGISNPERAQISLVTWDILKTTGVAPKLGRGFTEQDAAEGAKDVALISDNFWRTKLGGDVKALGQTINIDGVPTTVVGVMPASFELPSIDQSGAAEFYLPWTMGEVQRVARGRFLWTMARLKPGVSLQQAQAEMDSIAANLERELPDYDDGAATMVVPVREQIVGDVRPALLMLLGSVALVMLIVCVNIANLMLIRSAVRSREIAIRLALGMSRERLVQQLLTESILLSMLGGVAGIFLAYSALQVLLTLVPASLPQFTPIRINLPVMAFAFVLSVVTGALFGLAPALQALKMQYAETLRKSSGSVVSSGGRKLRNIFVVAEAALALILLVGAGLLMRSFTRLLNVDPGLTPQNVLTMRIDLSRAKYKDKAKKTEFFSQAVRGIRQLPEVQSVGAISFLPLGGNLGSRTGYQTGDHPIANPTEEPVADVRSVAGDYFQAMGIPMMLGRAFSESDLATDSIRKVVVSEGLARRQWPGENPIGKHIKMEWNGILEAEVIGMVRDIPLLRLDAEPIDTMYWYNPQFPYGGMTIVARTKGEPLALASAAGEIIKSIDPEQPIGKIEAMTAVLSDSVKAERFSMLLLAIFAGTALVLATLGLYGVISYMVAQRTQEIGVRMAFGATRGNIARLVIGEGMTLIAVGIALGIGGALLLTRFLQTMLFKISPTDVTTFAGVTAVLASIALLACYVPAYRAMHVEPVTALRDE